MLSLIALAAGVATLAPVSANHHQVPDFSTFGAPENIINRQMSHGSMFGHAVSIYGDFLLVGAHKDDTVAENCGAALVYEYVNNEWVRQSKLLPDDGAAYDYFGFAVSLYHHTAVIGSYRHDVEDHGSDAGAAYIYEGNAKGRNWKQVAKFTGSDSVSQDYFGYSVAVHGNTSVVGAWGNDNEGTFSGTAYVYSKYKNDNGEWSWQFNEQLYPIDSHRYDWFGISVAMSDDLIVVGASGADGLSAQHTGAAYIFSSVYDTDQWDGWAWHQYAMLLGPEGRSGDGFGSSVSASGNTVLVGAPGRDHASASGHRIADSGAVYVYTGSNDRWKYKESLHSNHAHAGGNFGLSVSVDGDTAVIGSYNDTGPGRIYIMNHIVQHDKSLWVHSFKRTPNEAQDGSAFGSSVSIQGERIAVGASGYLVTSENNSQHLGGVFAYYADSTTYIEVLPEDVEKDNTDDEQSTFGASLSLAEVFIIASIIASLVAVIVVAKVLGVGKRGDNKNLISPSQHGFLDESTSSASSGQRVEMYGPRSNALDVSISRKVSNPMVASGVYMKA